MSKVTIVIPAYNAGAFIQETLTSVIKQTYQDWQAIVVNNFSSDNTKEIVTSFQDPRITVVDFANHGVIAASRNHGISLAHSPFIAFLDADDLWYPEKLARCLDALEAGCDIVSHGEVYRYADGSQHNHDYGPTERSTYERLLIDGNCFSTSAVVCHRGLLQSLGGFDESPQYVTAEDYDLWLRIMARGARAEILPDMLGEFRIHSNSASSSLTRHFCAVTNVIKRHQREIIPANDSRTRRKVFKRLARYVTFNALLLIKKRQLRGAFQFVKQASFSASH